MLKPVTAMLYFCALALALVFGYTYHRKQLIAQGYELAMREVQVSDLQRQRELNKEIERLYRTNQETLREYDESKLILAGVIDRLAGHERWLREQNSDLARRLAESSPEACAAYAENVSGNYERLRAVAVSFGREAAECAAIAHANAKACNAALNGPEPVPVKSE